jgi:hypothetical protein
MFLRKRVKRTGFKNLLVFDYLSWKCSRYMFYLYKHVSIKLTCRKLFYIKVKLFHIDMIIHLLYLFIHGLFNNF